MALLYWPNTGAVGPQGPTGPTGPQGPAGGGGSFAFLGEVIANNSSSELDFTSLITAAYTDYQIEIVALAIGGAANQIQVQFSVDNGATYDTTGGHYIWWDAVQVPGGPGSAGSGSANNITIFSGNSSAAGASISGTLKIFDPQNTSDYKNITANMVGFDSLVSDPRQMGQWTGGCWLVTSAGNAFRFITGGSAKFVSGKVRVYGLRNS